MPPSRLRLVEGFYGLNVLLASPQDHVLAVEDHQPAVLAFELHVVEGLADDLLVIAVDDSVVRHHLLPKTCYAAMRTARSGASAALQATTWSMSVSRACTWCSPGCRSLKLTKSVNIDSATFVRTSAICSSPAIRRRCSAARAPPTAPYDTTPIALLFHSA